MTGKKKVQISEENGIVLFIERKYANSLELQSRNYRGLKK